MISRIQMLQKSRGIGEITAVRLINAFGDALPEVISDKERVADIAKVIRGKNQGEAYSRAVAAELIAEWKYRLAPEYEAANFLEAYGISNAALASKIASLLGSRTEEVLNKNPYILSRAMGWKTTDFIGQKLIGNNRNSRRFIGAVDAVMGDVLREGHTKVLKSKMLARAYSKLKTSTSDAESAIRIALAKKHIIDQGAYFLSPGAAWMENELRTRFLNMINDEESSIRFTRSYLDAILLKWASEQVRRPSEEQLSVIGFALSNQLSVITGGAGTGKTTTLRGVVDVWRELGGRIQLCTLSGKAALRLSQATHHLTKTIHKTIMELKKRQQFIKERIPVPEDFADLDEGTLLIVDEASMVDLGQFCQLIHHMPKGCRLLLVGDSAQLPPIGPGIVFHELCKYNEITGRLTKVFRQSEDSGIPVVSISIRDKQALTLDQFSGVGEGVSFVDCPVDRINNEVERVADQLGGFSNKNHELQVLAALNNRCFELNAMFHKKRKIGDEIKGPFGSYFSLNDPIVFLHNDYKRALFNGLLGRIKSIDAKKFLLGATFDVGAHQLGRKDIINIDLAYALSCHKLQGSQAERVIIVIEPTRLIEPSWLYTAVTRSVVQAVIVGPKEYLENCLARDPAWTRRRYGFALK